MKTLFIQEKSFENFCKISRLFVQTQANESMLQKLTGLTVRWKDICTRLYYEQFKSIHLSNIITWNMQVLSEMVKNNLTQRTVMKTDKSIYTIYILIRNFLYSITVVTNTHSQHKLPNRSVLG